MDKDATSQAREMASQAIAKVGGIDLSVAIAQAGGIVAAYLAFEGRDEFDDQRWKDWRIPSLRGVVAYADAALAALALPKPCGEGVYDEKWYGERTVGNMIANLRTLPADMPIYSAFHQIIPGKTDRCIIRHPTVSRERVDGREIKTGDTTVPYSAVIWSQPREPEPLSAPEGDWVAVRSAWAKVAAALDDVPGGMHADLEDAASGMQSVVDAAVASAPSPDGDADRFAASQERFTRFEGKGARQNG